MRDLDWEIIRDLYQTGSLTKVANMHYISQPSITKRIKNIEIEFDIKIFNRTSRGLVFTAEGEKLAEYALEHIDFMTKVREDIEDIKETQRTNIEIGSAYTFSKYVLTEVLAKYTEAHPGIRFDVVNAPSPLIFKKMLEGSLDIGFICGDYDGPINKVLVARLQAYIVTKEPLANLNDLWDMKYLSYTRNNKTSELLQGWWLEHFEKVPKVEMNVGLMDFAWPLIDKGKGYTYAFLPETFKSLRDLYLTPMLHKDGTPVTRNTWCVYSTSKRKTKQMSKFINFVEKEMKIN